MESDGSDGNSAKGVGSLVVMVAEWDNWAWSRYNVIVEYRACSGELMVMWCKVVE